MVERHLWTKNPHEIQKFVFGNVVERHLWPKNPHNFFFKKNHFFPQMTLHDVPEKSIFGFHVDFLSTNDAPRYTRFVGFLSTIYR